MTAYASISLPPTLERPITMVQAPTPSTPSFFIDKSRKSYKHQYSNIYFIRLHHLRDTVRKTAGEKWQGVKGNPGFVERVLDVEKGKLCYVVGTVYMDMPLKPNVIEDVARDQSIAPPPPPVKIFSPEDSIMLEDESGRVRLVGHPIHDAPLVTGIIMSALGMETPSGDFEVIDYCFADLAPQPHLEEEERRASMMDLDGKFYIFQGNDWVLIATADAGTSSSPEDEWVAVVSGLEIGTSSPSDAQIQMLTEYLTGEGGVVEEQVSAARISRLIIAGDSLAPIEASIVEPNQVEDRKGKRSTQDSTTSGPHPILGLGSTLQDIAGVMPINILPGASDPSGIIMPQQPFPRAMFGDAARYSTFSCETNPTYITLSTSDSKASPRLDPISRTFLINSGQPLNDMFKYLPTPPNTRLSMAESTLRWRHMAPTAPDTLWCHPYLKEDPFIIRETPNFYILGGQQKFGTRLVTDQQTEAKGKFSSQKRCRLVLVPSFSKTGILVLLNLRTLNVKTIKFGVHGMKVNVEPEAQKDPMQEPDSTPAPPEPSAPKSSMDYGFI
ncbi:DNA polymerase alpha/epsilon subunit B-domain-containing protein [Crepidotus variabilis]|uniref:DNA-directed DNA polymerase n=1 Tax=Crepidotus variabilis TaxID=179855 RepID=A0A9P6JUZ4_9AGAR|nr:DNA polymerase alpha/epsilon subunit B-domain-containing protein [Crepidotus variabilis]